MGAGCEYRRVLGIGSAPRADIELEEIDDDSSAEAAFWLGKRMSAGCGITDGFRGVCLTTRGHALCEARPFQLIRFTDDDVAY